jgi:hypothetical protein
MKPNLIAKYATIASAAASAMTTKETFLTRALMQIIL